MEQREIVACRQRNNGAGAGEQGYVIEWRRHDHIASAVVVPARVEVVPTLGVLRQVGVTFALARLDHVGDQQLRPEHEVVTVDETPWIMLEVVARWPQDGFATFMRI